MRRTIRSGAMRWGWIGAGVAGVVLALGTGALQPEESLPKDPVLRELALLKGGLFRAGSKLPADRSASIEQVLEQQGEVLARLSARLSMLDNTRLDAIERRLASFEQKINRLDTSEIDNLLREVGNLRRSLDSVARDVGNMPRVDLSGIARTLDDIQRRLGQTGASSGSTERELSQIQSTLRNIESQVQSIDRKLR